MARIDLTGQRFGRLTVLEYSHTAPNTRTYWKCRCDCGKISYVGTDGLRSGKTWSCGCLHRDSMHSRQVDITGQKFGKLTVLKFDHADKHHNQFWKCKCDCGNITLARAGDLKSGHKTSCGCNAGTNIIHGMSGSRLYHIHQNMIKRCYKLLDEHYPLYGGRGITICKEWYNPELTEKERRVQGNLEFQAFAKWAKSNGYNDKLSIDRKDVNGPYAPWNCRWITNAEQQLNKNNTRYIHDGEEFLVRSEFCKKYDLDPNYVRNRLEKGWSHDAIVYAVKHPELHMHIPRGSQKHKYPGKKIYLDKDEFQLLIPRIPDQVPEIL